MSIPSILKRLQLALALALLGSTLVTAAASAQSPGPFVVRVLTPNNNARVAANMTITGVAVDCSNGNAAQSLGIYDGTSPSTSNKLIDASFDTSRSVTRYCPSQSGSGRIGFTAIINTRDISEGPHTLTLVADFGSGASGSTTIDVVVGRSVIGGGYGRNYGPGYGYGSQSGYDDYGYPMGYGGYNPYAPNTGYNYGQQFGYNYAYNYGYQPYASYSNLGYSSYNPYGLNCLYGYGYQAYSSLNNCTPYYNYYYYTPYTYSNNNPYYSNYYNNCGVYGYNYNNCSYNPYQYYNNYSAYPYNYYNYYSYNPYQNYNQGSYGNCGYGYYYYFAGCNYGYGYITLYQAGQTVRNNSSAILSGFAACGAAGITQVSVYDRSVVANPILIGTSNTSGSFSFTWTPGPPLGSHTIQVIAQGAGCGNFSQSFSVITTP